MNSINDIHPSKQHTMLDIDTERRLTRNEQAIEDLDGNVKSLEQRVDAGFNNLENENKNIRNDIANSHSLIIEKMNKTQVADLTGKKASWPVIISVVSVIFGAVVVFVSWGMKQQQNSAVNEAVANVHHTYQTLENERNISWNRRQNDRDDDRDLQLTAIEKNYYEHREGRELEVMVDSVVSKTSDNSERIAVDESRQNEADRRLAILEEYSMTSMKDRSDHTSQLKDLQIELSVMRNTMRDLLRVSSQLEPLSKDMGLSTVKGIAERLDVIEDQVKDQSNRLWGEK